LKQSNEYKENELTSAHALVNQNISLVNRIAGYLKARVPKFMEYDDMVQIGMLGLLSAAETYDDKTGVAFKDYAKSRIKGAILDEVRKLSDISRLAIKNSQQHDKAKHELENEHGLLPKNSQIAEKLNISLNEYEKQRTHIDRFKIDKIDSDDGDAFDNLIGSKESPMALLEDEQLTSVVTELISKLNERKKLVLNLYYVEELNLKEIGAIIGVKESRVSQILSSIVKDLREEVARVA
jgi:RNA polymerase sigma factor for flagellar operon FliA